MAYADFAIESAEDSLYVRTRMDQVLPALEPDPVPAWLTNFLEQGQESCCLATEKSRSEILVAPILIAAADAFPADVTLFSGDRLDVDLSRGLSGEYDFLLALTTNIPRLRTPVVSVVQARQADIELGLGPCIAQMIGMRVFNEKAGDLDRPIFGCVTTGRDWQFLRLTGQDVLIDRRIFFLSRVDLILAAFRFLLEQAVNGASLEKLT